MVLLFFFPSCTTRTNDLYREGLKGKVKTNTEYEYFAVEKFGDVLKQSLFLKETYNYNNNGDIIDYNLNYIGLGGIKKNYEHNEKINKISENSYDSEGKIFIKRISKYKYDDKGNIIELNTYNEDGSILYKNIYNYDENNNKVEWKAYKADGILWINSKFKYDKNRNVIEEIYYENDKPVRKYTYIYNEYDNKGNWIKKILYFNDNPIKITEREIHYF